MKCALSIVFFCIGLAFGAVGGHYHGVAVTLQGLMTAQADMLDALNHPPGKGKPAMPTRRE